MSNNEAINDFINKVDHFINTEVNELTQNINAQENGVLLFNELKPGFSDFQSILSKIKPEYLEFLPDFKFADLVRRLNPLFQKVGQIQGTAKNPNQPDEQQIRATINVFTKGIDIGNPDNSGFFIREKDAVWDIIIQSITLANEEIKTKTETQNIRKNLLKIEKEAEGIKSRLVSALNSAQTELSKSGVEHHADIFKKQAVMHRENAIKWNKRAIFLLIGTLSLALIFFLIIAFAINPNNTKTLIETSVLAALMISFSTYAFTLAIKNYFAEKHNESINQHKANCLSTFNTFIDSADLDRKSAILLQATHTIFSHQSSGFLSKENDIQHPNPIVEVVRNISKK